jgi:tetratricopeptide (TPR) repeat protein
MGPRSFLLTGPTLREFHVREVAVEELCPDGSTVATPEGVRPPTPRATLLSGLPSGGGSPVAREAVARRALASGLAHLAAGRYVLASERAGQAASLFPRWQEAYRVICSSRSALGEREDAMYSCAAALLLGREDPVARRELDAAMSAGKGTGTRAEAVRSARDWIAAGQAAYREQRFEDSVEAAARALRKEPRLTEAWELVDAGSAAAGHREDAARAHRITLGLSSGPASPR